MMKGLQLLSLCVLGMVVVCYGAIDADQVMSLPGWTESLPSKQYSGYLDVGDGKHLHYWLVESENNVSFSSTKDETRSDNCVSYGD